MNQEQPFNALSPAEVERLAVLAEECGETIQIVGKILRHGYESYSPYDSLRTTNRTLLTRELGDVLAMMWAMNDTKDIVKDDINKCATDKQKRIGKYMHHQSLSAPAGE